MPGHVTGESSHLKSDQRINSLRIEDITLGRRAVVGGGEKRGKGAKKGRRNLEEQSIWLAGHQSILGRRATRRLAAPTQKKSDSPVLVSANRRIHVGAKEEGPVPSAA